MPVDAPGAVRYELAGDAAVSPYAGSSPVPFLVLHAVFSFLVDLIHVLRRSDHDQAREFVLLRQQLRLYECQAT